jgi:hypothetical protein
MTTVLKSPWLRWQSDIPCRFSLQDGTDNHEFLIKTIGQKWLLKGTTSPGHTNHPLLHQWTSASADSFVALNILAEDLRSLEGVDGLERVVEDLKNSALSTAARHVIHSSALFARWRREQLTRFLPQSAASLPDYVLQIDGQGVAVEAKVLLQSEIEERFNQFAAQVSDLILKEVHVLLDISPEIYVIIKNPEKLPQPQELLAAVLHAVQSFGDQAIEVRAPNLNVFLGLPQSGFEVFQSCHILSPRSPRENMRAMSRGKKASDQLRSEATLGLPGVFFLELGQYQDPHELRDMFEHRFNNGQFQGIAGIILSRSTIHRDSPLVTPLDLLGWFPNPHSATPVPPTTSIRYVGAHGSLFEAQPRSSTLPAYTHRIVQCKVPPNPGNLELRMPLIHGLTPELLM